MVYNSLREDAQQFIAAPAVNLTGLAETRPSACAQLRIADCRFTGKTKTEKRITMKENITYVIGNKLYVNLTNKCPCNCTFCIRNNGEGAYGSDSLWLDHDPTCDEAVEALSKHDLDSFEEVVFCGYGEPTEALGVLLCCAAHVKGNSKTPVRINTNGLSDLINKKPTAHLFQGLADVVSISLNAPTKEEYDKVTRPSFENAFQAMQDFAVDCLKYVPEVVMTVVDVIPKEQIEQSKALAEKLGVKLRIRKYEP